MVPLKYSPKYGLILNLVTLPFTCFATIIPYLLTGVKRLPFEVSEVHTYEDLKYAFNRNFTFTDQYLSLFHIGIIVGYFLRNKQLIDKHLTNRRAIRILIGIYCYSMSVLGIAWSENFKDMNIRPNKFNLNVWLVFGKILWAFGNVWLIYDVFSNKNGMFSP